MIVDLRTLPTSAAVAVEAWRRAEYATGNHAWHREQYVRIHADCTDRAHQLATDAIAAIRRGAQVIERPANAGPREYAHV